MIFDELKKYCEKLRSKGTYSIDPVDVRVSQNLVKAVLPELVGIVELAMKLKEWSPSHCYRFNGTEEGLKILCACSFCSLQIKIRRALGK